MTIAFDSARSFWLRFLIALIISPRGRKHVSSFVFPEDRPLDPDEPVAILRNLHETKAR